MHVCHVIAKKIDDLVPWTEQHASSHDFRVSYVCLWYKLCNVYINLEDNDMVRIDRKDHLPGSIFIPMNEPNVVNKAAKIINQFREDIDERSSSHC